MIRVLHQLYARPLTIIVASILIQFGNPVNAEVKNEHKVKAAIVYKLLRYISWPEEALIGAKINLCVDKNDSFFKAFSDVNGRVVLDREIFLKERPEQVSVNACHIVFTSANNDHNSLALVKKAGKGVLTISDAEQFAERGGMINLFIENNRVRFKINPHAAYQSELRINSSLLRLADIVETNSTENKPAKRLHADSEAFE